MGRKQGNLRGNGARLGQVATRLAALTALALAGCSSSEGAPRNAPPPGARYVALGSSFAAGSGIDAIKPGTPERCGRSRSNYAALLAQRLGLALDDQSCGGATTRHSLGPWGELPAQIDAVTADTRLVTVTVGGNDIGYVGNLFAGTCRALGIEALDLGKATLPCKAMRGLPMPTETAYHELGDNLRQIADLVHARAPQAKLVFVQYVTLVSNKDCPDAHLLPADRANARDIGLRLAKVTAEIALEKGAAVLAADELSRDHTPCDAQPWAIGFPRDPKAIPGAAWHPNLAGHAAITDALANMLGS